MNTCSIFQHPEARQTCYAVMSGQLGDKQAQQDLSEMKANAPADSAEIGSQQCPHQQASEQLRLAAQRAGKA